MKRFSFLKTSKRGISMTPCKASAELIVRGYEKEAIPVVQDKKINNFESIFYNYSIRMIFSIFLKH